MGSAAAAGVVAGVAGGGASLQPASVTARPALMASKALQSSSFELPMTSTLQENAQLRNLPQCHRSAMPIDLNVAARRQFAGSLRVAVLPLIDCDMP
jgi:hypothetical protein